MFLTKKHLSRRMLLKGAGVSLALPLLDAMIPAATALSQTAAARKLRMGFFYLPHGAIMGNTSLGASVDKWNPSGAVTDFKLNAIVSRWNLQAVTSTETSKTSHGGRRPQPRSRNLVERYEAGRQSARRQNVRDSRSGRRRPHQPGHDSAISGVGFRNHDTVGCVRRRALLLQFHSFIPRCHFAAADGI
jgi:hypothetical protein